MTDDRIEGEMLEVLEFVVKQRMPTLQNPNYRKSQEYSPQWKCEGDLYWYETPRGEVLAIKTSEPFSFTVSTSDLSHELDLMRSTVATSRSSSG